MIIWQVLDDTKTIVTLLMLFLREPCFSYVNISIYILMRNNMKGRLRKLSCSNNKKNEHLEI